jgi:hypothetical protein
MHAMTDPTTAAASPALESFDADRSRWLIWGLLLWYSVRGF